MTNHAPLFAPVHESPCKSFLVVAALLTVLPLALYVAANFFNAPIFPSVWVAGIMPGWPLALFLVIEGLPNSTGDAPAKALRANRAVANRSSADHFMLGTAAA